MTRRSLYAIFENCVQRALRQQEISEARSGHHPLPSL